MRTLATKPGLRPRIGILATAVAVVLAALSPTVAASADPAPTPSPSPTHHPLAMGTFSVNSYAAKAARLPAGLVTALHRDLGITGAEYLADADASARAVDVVSSLKSAGVRVLGSEIHGTKLTVNIASSSDASAVTATGATAVVGSPVTEDFSKRDFHSVTTNNTYGGQGYFFFQNPGQTSGTGARCSIGFNGYSVANGAPQFATAGHCATVMNGQTAHLITQNKPSDNGGTLMVTSQALGTAVPGEAQYGSGRDYGIVGEGAAGLAPQPSVYTWGSGGIGGPLDTAPIGILDATAAIMGGNLCKSGATSGYTCGTISAVDQSVSVSSQIVNSIVASTCVLPGDSGGSAIDGQHALGISSGSDFPDVSNPTPSTCNNGPTCTTLSDGTTKAPCDSVFFPMIASHSGNTNSVLGQQGTRWQLAVQVASTVSLTAPASGSTVYSFSKMTGTITSAVPTSTALLYLDGSTTPWRRVAASSGSFSIPLTGMPVGMHTYKLAAGLGWSPGATVSGTITIGVAGRIGGIDRYQVAVNMAQQEFPLGGPIPVLYVANGLNYPDGLSAAPAAAFQHGTLLLTDPSAVPSNVMDEVKALKPAKLEVAGGTGSVSDAVLNSLIAAAANPTTGWPMTVHRDGGLTRYESSQSVAMSAFPASHIDKVFIANGGNFPDALSETGAAAKNGSPVLLVPGDMSSLDHATIHLIQGWSPSEIVIAGGTASVSPGIETQLHSQFPGATVIRLGGIDRYVVSNLINTTFFSSSANAYFANGGNFPDALGGGVLAAANNAPLTVTPSDCMEPYDVTALATWGTTKVTLIGGTASQSDAVASFTPCS